VPDGESSVASKLNPGSDEAVAAGCKCPVLDNRSGWGSSYGKGKFWMNADCPIHGLVVKQIREEQGDGNQERQQHGGDSSAG
jgi:hypothetical protein